MTGKPRFRRLFRLPLRGRWHAERELDDELEAHLQLCIDDLVRRGASPDEARALAAARFGDLPAARHRLRAGARRRDAALRQRDRVGGLVADLRVAWRRARRAPGATVLTLLTLALGIGLTTATFTLVDGVLLRPLPFTEPDRLVSLTGRDSLGRDVVVVSSANWLDWRRASRLMDGMALHFDRSLSIVTPDGAQRVRGEVVSGNFFEVLRTHFLAGRPFDEDEAQRHLPVAVVSEALWRRVGGADAVVPVPLRVGDSTYSVVGVVADGYGYPAGTELWITTAFHAEVGAARNNVNWLAIGRLRNGVTTARGQEELDRIARGIHERDPVALYSYGVNVRALRDVVVGNAGTYLPLLMLAVVAVLLIACSNLAAANLARGASRSREFAVRTALGAGRGRLVQQLLVEQLLLALAGGAVGIWLAWVAVRANLAAWLSSIPRVAGVHLHPGIVLFAVVISLTAGVVTGLAPATRGSRVAPQAMLSSGARATAAGGTAGPFLIAGEIALALVLLTASALLIRSFRALVERDLGFDPRVATAEADLSAGRFPTPTGAVAYWEGAMRTLRATPGIDAVGVANWIPLHSAGLGFVEITGRDVPGAGAGYRAVSAGYFTAMRIPLLTGRLFDATDGPNSRRVVVINHRMAERYWPGESPLGKTVRALSQEGFRPGVPAPLLTVVGVVGDVRHYGFESTPDPEMYVDYRQVPWRAYGMTAVVRGTMPLDHVEATVRRLLHALDPGVAVDIGSLSARLDAELAGRRFTLSVLSGFGTCALVLAAIGLYALLSYAVAVRTRELALRAALGATRGQQLALVTRAAGRVVLVGAVAGILAALGVARAMRSLLVDVQPLDARAFAASLVVLVVVAAVAVVVPAWRAARLDPMVALQAE